MNAAVDLQNIFLAKKWTLATSESCTGGLLGGALTSVPGSSGYYLGGGICYQNAVKSVLSEVSEKSLSAYGAVSPEVAREMAAGIRSKLGSDWGVSTTGVAGPDGGTEQKPVGLVYIGIAGPDGVDAIKCLFSGERDSVRKQAVAAAILNLEQRLAACAKIFSK
jgi:nicotinamide-nucleotide amidase